MLRQPLRAPSASSGMPSRRQATLRASDQPPWRPPIHMPPEQLKDVKRNWGSAFHSEEYPDPRANAVLVHASLKLEAMLVGVVAPCYLSEVDFAIRFRIHRCNTDLFERIRSNLVPGVVIAEVSPFPHQSERWARGPSSK